uniref:Uncharacterized protein n=1 Tax=Anguilla anguilla TaxID=7936 RepID=A0A0E9VPJ3_ANGAN
MIHCYRLCYCKSLTYTLVSEIEVGELTFF